ncbi:MAG: hypothetical protein J6T11_06915 [Bacteroidaceae bacterium]|nr:hypothetical protein [Bacteroidaceae bacterium]
MKKRTFQWLSVFVLMVMSTLAFVACSKDDDNNKNKDDNGGDVIEDNPLLGTWDVVVDGSPETPYLGKTFVFKNDGTCTIGDENLYYSFQGGTEDIEGNLIYGLSFWQGKDDNKKILFVVGLFIMNNGNVLNGNIFGDSPEDSYPLVLKKAAYTYPTEGIQGRWQFTYVAQPFGDYDEYMAERLPMAEKGEVFVLDENGRFYIEGDIDYGNGLSVGTYTWANNRLTLRFGGKYGVQTVEVGGLIEFSNNNTMTIPQGRGTIKYITGETYGFTATIVRVE